MTPIEPMVMSIKGRVLPAALVLLLQCGTWQWSCILLDYVIGGDVSELAGQQDRRGLGLCGASKWDPPAVREKSMSTGLCSIKEVDLVS